MKSLYILAFSLLGLLGSVCAQSTFKGLVLNEANDTLVGATVNWQGSTIAANTDENGIFEIERPDTSQNLILEVHYIGYPDATIEVYPSDKFLEIVVPVGATNIEQITVETTQRGNFSSTLNPLNIETISACELKRAACCSLAESFETNATVNVNYSDALTGAREIEMLGLRGTYLQMMVENRPTINRLDRAYGMEYIPGTWIESIQISKGASTVRNGAQSITGQINTELIKPHRSDPFFLNIYLSHISWTNHRLEVNSHLNFKLSPKWSTGLLLHGNMTQGFTDNNKDSFLDTPQKRQGNALWRLFHTTKKWHVEWNVQGILDWRQSGQTAKTYEKVFDTTATRLYNLSSNVRRLEAFGKVGFLGFKNPSQSLAMVYGGNIHEQRALFGDRSYNALQREGYANLIFMTGLGHPDHSLTAGLTYNIAQFDEHFSDVQWNRVEQVVGAYAEYSYIKTLNKEKGSAVGLIAGIRGDLFVMPNFTKVFPSPRLNFKYNVNQDIVFRLSAGRGVRQPNLLIENMRYMAGQRDFVIEEQINPETAWNYGMNFGYNFRFAQREGNLNVDFYRTDFENQLIADMDSNEEQLRFYNLRGKSFAHSFLLTYTQDIVKGFEVRLAYKFNDVRTTFNDTLRLQPFSPQHRGLITLHYITPNKRWQFNLTGQLVGPQRLPMLTGDMTGLPHYRHTAVSPTYFTGIFQISHYTKKNWEIYLGGENISNYTQKQPILGWDNPFGTDPTKRAFDATSVYAPVMGFMLYVGVRYTFKPKAENAQKSSARFGAIDIKSSVQCGTCEEIITEGLLQVKGIESVSVDIPNKVVRVHFNRNKINEESVRIALTRLGYDADKLPADTNAYNALPSCCQKGGHD